MLESKKWYASKTMWANSLAMVAALLGAFNIDLGLTPEMQVMMVGFIMGGVNIVLRYVTKAPIG